MSTPIASHTIRANILEPALEARGANLAEQRLLDARDTPEIDSLLEEVLALKTYSVPPRIRARLLAYIDRIARLNQAEGAQERAIAGAADELAEHIRNQELNSGLRKTLTVKTIARQLRPVLPILDQPAGHDAATIMAAHRIFHEIAAAVPVSELLTRSIEHELRPTAYAQLVRVHSSWSAR